MIMHGVSKHDTRYKMEQYARGSAGSRKLKKQIPWIAIKIRSFAYYRKEGCVNRDPHALQFM